MRYASRHGASSDFTVAQSLLPTGRTGFALFVGCKRTTKKESTSTGKQRLPVMQKIRSASGLPSMVYWVVTGLVRTQRLQNSPPRICGLLQEQDRLHPCRHCRLPPSGVSADCSSYGHINTPHGGLRDQKELVRCLEGVSTYYYYFYYYYYYVLQN